MMRFHRLLAIAMTAAVPFTAIAQSDWPTRPVRIVSFLAPGGLSDTLARILAQNFETRLNGKFFVENRTGGGGAIGALYVAEQAPDGYTLGISGIGSNVIAPALNPNAGFDPMRSFTHVAFLGGAPTALVVHPSLRLSNVNDFITLARAKGGVPFASSGAGTQGHLIGELFKRSAAIPMTHIPYRGANPVMTDLIAGHVPAAFVTISSAAQHVRAGTVKALAITSAERLPQFRDVPTFVEAGYPDLVALTWFALCAPAGLPQAIVVRLNEAAVATMSSVVVARQLEAESVQVLRLNAGEFSTFVQAEVDRWGPVAKSLNVKRE